MQPNKADQLVHEATSALAMGDVNAAAERLDQVLNLEPEHLLGLTKRAEILLLRRQTDAAQELLDAVLGREMHFAPAWAGMARLQWAMGQPHAALASIQRAFDIQPHNPEYRIQFAQFAGWTGDAALAASTLVPLLDPTATDMETYASALAMAGECALADARFDAAEGFLTQALSLAPHLCVPRMVRGMNWLRRGDFKRGWADYAAREHVTALYPDGPPDLPGAPWQGGPLNGRSMLVIDDQGFGDAIQLLRYVPLLQAQGAGRITWVTFPTLVRLFRAACPDITVTASVPRDQAFDLHSNSTALPRWCGTTLDTIPMRVPYLTAPSRLRPVQRAGERKRVGFIWSGDARHTRDHLRSISAAAFLRLADIPNVQAFSLQHRIRAEDLAEVERRPGLIREIEHMTDFAETAALIRRLDLVVTVDTAVAHLAGALGRPVWIVLHQAPDWRWMDGRETSPWYPTARLFRVQRGEWPSEGGGWEMVLERVAAALRDYVTGGKQADR